MTLIINGIEEFRSHAGKHMGTSDWLEITQEMIDKFADAGRDWYWIHVDPQKAKDGPFGKTIAHGLLTLSLIVPLKQDVFEVRHSGVSLNYGLNKVRFISPVVVGSRIRMSVTLHAVEDVGEGVQTVLDLTVEIEGNEKPAMVAQSLIRYYPASTPTLGRA